MKNLSDLSNNSEDCSGEPAKAIFISITELTHDKAHLLPLVQVHATKRASWLWLRVTAYTHTAPQAVKKMAMFSGPAKQHWHTERAWEARGYTSTISCTGMQFAAYSHINNSSTYLSWTYVTTHTHSPTIAYTYTSSYSAVMLQPSCLKTISSLSYNFKLGFKCSDFRLVMSNFLRVHNYTTFYWPAPRLFPPPALAVCSMQPNTGVWEGLRTRLVFYTITR